MRFVSMNGELGFEEEETPKRAIDSETDKRLTKTFAKEFYSLNEKDISFLSYETKSNRRNKAYPIKLFLQTDIEKIAIGKHGSLDNAIKLSRSRAQERDARAEAKRQKSIDECLPSVSTRVALSRECCLSVPLASLESRVHIINEGGKSWDPKEGNFVLYWMHSCIRLHHNMALALAGQIAHAYNKPLRIVCGFPASESPKWWPTLRRLAFLVQGCRDLLMEAERWNSSGNPLPPIEIYIDRKEQGMRPIIDIAKMASVVVADDMPVQPHTQWIRNLSDEIRSTEIPILSVDSFCNVPFRCAEAQKSTSRAYLFRSNTEARRKQAILKTVLELDAHDREFHAEIYKRKDDDPLLFYEADTIDILQDCDNVISMLHSIPFVDSDVKEVRHLRGGQTFGYKRWEFYRNDPCGLGSYASRRNDFLSPNAVSRLSAYHHWGMISPFHVAYQAHKSRNAGSSKFLDEFLVWRELSYAFCSKIDTGLLHESHSSMKFLPSWAQQTLCDHQRDKRLKAYTQEELESAQTGDKVWDAMQRCLIRHGELHNNLRMTWGKAFVIWTESPSEGICSALEINHRFALDGGDPCSYAGIMWCFGSFDSPKNSPNTPVSGSIRPRSTRKHARQLGRFEELIGDCQTGINKYPSLIHID